MIATATCADPQGETLTTTVDFGDGASSSGTNNGVFTAWHTYAAYTQQITCPIFVTATNTSELQSVPAQYSWTLVPTALAPPVFAGQSSNVTVMLASPSGQSELVMFQCTTVTTTCGATPTQASALGISCSSNPPKITLFASQPVTIVIQTTGGATASVPGMGQQTWSYAFLMPLPIFAFLGAKFNSTRSRRGRFSYGFALSGLLVLALLTVSCGGGFTAPKVIQATPAGNYQVTIIDVPVSSTTSGFVQTSLIVPLTVSPFQ